MTIKEQTLIDRNKNKNHLSNIEKILVDSAYNSKNFDKTPPIVGIVLADQYGNTLMILEYDSKENYRPIKTFITQDTSFLEVDLISMYFSSFKVFATQTNIQNLSHLEIYGSNLKIQIHFLFDNYMIILFLNSNTNLNSVDKEQIMKYFKKILIIHKFEFLNFNASSSLKVIRTLERKGKKWLENLNRAYTQTYKNLYFRKHQIIEKFIRTLGPIIERELIEYLENIPEETLDNLSKEIKNKIQDQLFEFSFK
ncbi:MAG: hypothetical protein ACFFBY_07120 [Promethearchaeota archaeon]